MTDLRNTQNISDTVEEFLVSLGKSVMMLYNLATLHILIQSSATAYNSFLIFSYDASRQLCFIWFASAH